MKSNWKLHFGSSSLPEFHFSYTRKKETGEIQLLSFMFYSENVQFPLLGLEAEKHWC